jgi:hypothetical protein
VDGNISTKVDTVQVMKAYGGGGDIAPFILIFDTRRRLVINLTSLPLYPRKSTPVPIG